MTTKEAEDARKVLHKAQDLYFLGLVECIAEGVEELTKVEQRRRELGMYGKPK
ncbi:MAG: hypothetical protein KAW92_10605 [Candidatus Cloacimonetes bacterium]|nr:hypothetical protein [Candidatus Cloacimonadota bacterium]